MNDHSQKKANPGFDLTAPFDPSELSDADLDGVSGGGDAEITLKFATVRATDSDDSAYPTRA